MMTCADDDVFQVLRGINDPELGINIVDLGLVYRVARTPHQIDVAITLTTPSCPLGEMILEEARYALEQRFPVGPPIHVELTWKPLWMPERMTEAARRLLG